MAQGRADTQGQCCPSNCPQLTCTFLQPLAKTLHIPMAGLMASHAALTLSPLVPWVMAQPSTLLCSLPHGAAGLLTQHLQGTHSVHWQPRGALRDCLLKLTFWGQESYFQLFQRQCFHCSLSASTGGRDALPGGAMASSFVLGCGAQHQLHTTGSSSSLLCLPSAWTRCARRYPWIPTWAGGSGASHVEEGWWKAQGRAWGPCSCLRPSQHQQVVFYTP